MAIRNIDEVPLKELFGEYSNLLFKRKDFGGFNFEPNNNSEAEYWYHFFHRELESLERRYEQVKDNLERLSPLGDYPQKLKLANIYQDIEKTKQLAEAVNSWFEKNGLTAPANPTELEWEVMESAYTRVVKENTKKRLSKVSDKFSTEGEKKEDWNGSIWALTDEMRTHLLRLRNYKNRRPETFAARFGFRRKLSIAGDFRIDISRRIVSHYFHKIRLLYSTGLISKKLIRKIISENDQMVNL